MNRYIVLTLDSNIALLKIKNMTKEKGIVFTNSDKEKTSERSLFNLEIGDFGYLLYAPETKTSDGNYSKDILKYDKKENVLYICGTINNGKKRKIVSKSPIKNLHILLETYKGGEKPVKTYKFFKEFESDYDAELWCIIESENYVLKDLYK